jgi:hypothetical protein
LSATPMPARPVAAATPSPFRLFKQVCFSSKAFQVRLFK